MTTFDDAFLPRGSVKVSQEALAFAREFAVAIGQLRGGSQIVAFDWALSMIEHVPGQPDRELGPCLLLGAYRREEIPIEARDLKDGFEFAIKIPDDVLTRCPLKRIDRDDTKPFQLVVK